MIATMIEGLPLESAGAEIAGRYRIEQLLGRGGNAAVYAVRDQKSGHALALKRSWARDQRKLERANLSIEREYHVLSQLAHPGIIQVYDYGLDERGAYYTMELLDGSDLDQGEPLAWRRVCSVLCDVASSLAILHSRGLVHRDVSARNVRYTSEGRAKLIDFGAMVSMGVAKEAVGTPPFMAPEVLQVQALDARADLFSLGALGYFLLLGRHAYPARRLSDLRDVWRTRPQPPARALAELPVPLSELLMQLLALDRNARPSNAAEVIERLSALADLPLEAGARVPRAYLATPSLQGRERALVTMRRHMLSLVRGDGATLLVRGAAGMGRSRLLDACALEGKLLGATVARADGGAGPASEWSVARTLGSQLLELLPERSAEAARLSRPVLGHLLEALRESGDDPAPPERSLLIRELRDFVLALARTTRIVLVIDDADRIDQPSAALITALAHKTDRHALMLAVAIDTEHEHPTRAALRILDDVAKPIDATPLGADDSLALLRSVFGDVPNLALCAARIHELAQGSPRAVMEFAQHLLDRGLARYSAGSWSLPAELHPGDLPSSLAAALAARIERITGAARELLDALALADGDDLPASAYAALAGHADSGRTFALLDELVSMRVLATDSERYYIAQRGIADLVSALVPEPRRVVLHARIADALAADHGDVVRRGHHLLCAGRDLEAIELLCGINLVQRLPPLPLLERLLERAERHDLLPRVLHELRIAVMSKAAVAMATESFRRTAPLVLRQLEYDSGLERYRALADVPAQERLSRALAETQTRFLATPERERVHPFPQAIRELARYCGSTTSLANPVYELELIDSLPSLAPLAPLSPALDIVGLLCAAAREVVTGTGDRGISLYRRVLERLSQPDRGGFDEAQYHRSRLGAEYACGALEAGLGITIEQRALVLESDRAFRVSAWRIRVLMHLHQGNVEEARRCARRAELLRLQEGLEERYAASTLAGEVFGYALVGDLLGLKSTFESINALAANHARWRPIQLYAEARFRQLQGDLSGALVACTAALELAPVGRHSFYSFIAALHVGMLEHIGVLDEAAERAEGYLEIFEREDLELSKLQLQRQAAQVFARIGAHARALELIDDAIAVSERLERRGFALGRLYEARARIALQAGDRAGFQSFVERCAEQYNMAHNPRLRARLTHLIDHADDSFGGRSARPAALAALLEQPESAPRYDTVHSRMLECVDEFDRGRCALTLLLQSTESTAGCLFGIEDGSPKLLAAIPEGSSDGTIEAWIDAFVDAELHAGDLATASVNSGDETDSDFGSHLRFLHSDGRHFEGVVLVTEGTRERRIVGVLALVMRPGPHVLPSRLLCNDLASSLYEHGVSGVVLRM